MAFITGMNKWVELILGLLILAALIIVAWASSAYSWTLFGKSFNFLSAAWTVLKGAVFWFVAFVAALLILLGINDLRE